MKRFLMALGLTAIVCTGCDEIVFELSPSGVHPSDPDPAPPSSEDDDPPTPSAVAIRGGDVPPDFGFRMWEDPDSLVLIFDSDAQECPPTVIEATCDNAPRWQFMLALPPEFDAPGPVDLRDPRVSFHESLSEAVPDCAFGGGTGTGGGYFRGTIEIVSSDETSLVVRAHDVGLEGQVNGDFTVQRCSAAADPATGE
ncbi:hypothetical protein SOCE26_090080 [Sorangium cellulosum]|uniref:Uncharacterized protein n=1 Tax=Sorangium cellulosum TaxID=56 RepID=A0A2L0F7J6_SORCE|nr:hypothetical protein [Sorangium cellulosum]AUX47487.1 hypothetical protein SOCE26_090080 [Sorangium cellulosum]